MENEAEKIIAEQVKKLPKEVRDALASQDLHNKITSIGERHHLHIDQIGYLEDEVVLVMMGMTSPQDLSAELTKQLSLQPTDAEAIVDEISQEIFLPIRDAMKKFTGGETPSVVMPSAINTPATAPPTKPASVNSVPAVTVPPKLATPPPTPNKLLEIHAADLMLNEPTVSMPPKPAAPSVSTPAPTAPTTATSTPTAAAVEPPKPAPYKADPYREPPE